jgi:hypothetical protein
MRPLACLIALTIAAPAHADEIAPPPPPHNSVGVDGAVVLPLGDYAQGVNFAAGALVRIEIPVGTGFVTGRAGALFHAVKDDVGNLTFIPLYGGYRLPIGTNGLYVAGELGITIGYASVDTGFGTASDSDSKLGITLGAGMKAGALDLRGSLFLPDVDNLMGLMGTVGYDFAAF